jgi:lipopolysaccharide export system protein LptC
MTGPRNDDDDMPFADEARDTLPHDEDGHGEGGFVAEFLADHHIGRYSRFVSWMKIALPLSAIALLALVLFYSGVFSERDRLAIKFREIASFNNDLRMVSPHVSGLDSNGRPYLLTADTATQAKDEPSHITLENLQADLKLSNDGEWISLTATSGVLDSETEKLDLQQKIDVYASNGYEFHGTSGTVNFRKGTFFANQPVEGHGPAGTLRADKMAALDGGQKLIFMGNVKMRLNPKR